jgi:TolB-like protein/Tfp pilus assembly protein PilF
VAVIPLKQWSESDQAAIRQQLDRVLHSGPFRQSQRRQRFLEYLVNETLAGRTERLKGYNIALEVFGRPETFDPIVHPLVRIEAARLREKLREYYGTEGQSDSIHIDLPKGTYTPHIEFCQRATPDTWPHRPNTTIPDQTPGPTEGPVAAQPRWRKTPLGFIAASIAAVLLALLAGFTAWKWWTPSTSLFEKASIAVLPFENIGNESKWDRFADGITEDVVTDLSHSKDLFVVARNSTEVYRGKPADVRTVGRDLGVRYVLEGSIQPSGDQIRVTAQLVDTRTGGQVWSNRYDRPATDLFKVQSDVTEKISATLTGFEGAVAEAERSLIRRKPPSDLTAYESYLLGMEAKHKVTKEGLDEAERLFRKALAIDPQLARAYVGLAYVYEYRLEFGLGASAENQARHIEAARNAVRLDPNDGETQLVLGHAFAYHGMADQALEQFARAEALAPNNADLLILIAWYIPQFGQYDRAVQLAEKALQLNPNYPYWYNQGLRYVYFFGRQFDKSAKYAKRVTDPFAMHYAYLAAASAMTDDMAGAKAAAAEVVRLDPNWSVEKYMSDGGGYPDDAAMLLIEGARKAGVAACVPADKLSSMPNLIHIKACDEERTHQAAG